MDDLRSGKIFVLVPEELADEILEPLREHYRDDPVVEPIVERRTDQRRSGVDRRMLRLPVDDDRRAREPNRRQRADRRAPLLPRDLTDDLPPELAEHASRLRWAQRLDPLRPHHQALPTQSLVEAVAAGHLAVTAELYWRCYERIYQRLCQHMDSLRADAMTKDAFGRVLDRLGSFDASEYSERAGNLTPFDLFVGDVVDEFAGDAAAA